MLERRAEIGDMCGRNLKMRIWEGLNERTNMRALATAKMIYGIRECFRIRCHLSVLFSYVCSCVCAHIYLYMDSRIGKSVRRLTTYNAVVHFDAPHSFHPNVLDL